MANNKEELQLYVLIANYPGNILPIGHIFYLKSGCDSGCRFTAKFMDQYPKIFYKVPTGFEVFDIISLDNVESYAPGGKVYFNVRKYNVINWMSEILIVDSFQFGQVAHVENCAAYVRLTVQPKINSEILRIFRESKIMVIQRI